MLYGLPLAFQETQVSLLSAAILAQYDVTLRRNPIQFNINKYEFRSLVEMLVEIDMRVPIPIFTM